MLKALTIFFSTAGTRPALVLICLLLASAAESISVSSLLPVAASIAAGSGVSSDVNDLVSRVVKSIGLTPTLGNFVLLVAGFMVLKSALSFVALSYAGISAARVAISLRQRLIKAIFAAKFGFFNEQKGGNFANAISNDAGRAGEAYYLSAQIVSYLTQAVAYGLVALAINWKFAMLGIAASALAAGALQQLVIRSKRAGYKQTDRTAALTVAIMDALNNMKPIKAMNRHEPMLAEIFNTLMRLKRALITRELARSGLAQGSDAIMAVLAAIGVYFAVTVAAVSLPELLVSCVIFFQIVSIASKLQKSVQLAVQVESAYAKTEELIRLIVSNREENFGSALPDASQGCRFEHVSLSYGRTRVLSDVSLSIPPRALTVLNGPSGSGKTTIIDLLIGLNRPDRGEILIGKTSIHDIDIKAWREMIGYVPQELNLLHASIRDNVSLGDVNITDEAITTALAMAGLGDFIASLPDGLSTTVGEMGRMLSGGQRQRLSLARALVSRPQILILDEVTSALDPSTEMEIVKGISALRAQYTILAITHRPAWTQAADRLYTVKHGRVKVSAPLPPTEAPE